MPNWASATLQEKGIDFLRTNCTFMVLVKAFAPGDTVATVTANELAKIARVPGDYTMTTPSAGIRRVTSLEEPDVAVTASSVAEDIAYFVFHDGTTVHYATPEKSRQPFTEGNSATFPDTWLETPQPEIVP